MPKNIRNPTAILILSVLIGLVISYNSHAQLLSKNSDGKELYFGVEGGYGFAFPGTTNSIEAYGTADMKTSGTSLGTQWSESVQSKNISLGKGLNTGIYGGCWLTKNFG